jgi:hypothetical protein
MAQLEALMSYRHLWLPRLGYPLACWPLDKSQLRQVAMNATNTFRPKMGFCRMTCSKVIFDSKAYGSFDLTALADIQGLNQVTLFLEQDAMGEMLTIGYAWAQMFLDVSYQILSQPSMSLQNAPLGWFDHLFCKFLGCIDISINVLPKFL